MISTDAFSVEPYGIMLRADDPAFKKVVDAADDGDSTRAATINAIYDKWFLKTIPPKGMNLNVPMSAVVQEGRRQADRYRRSGVVCTVNGHAARMLGA